MLRIALYIEPVVFRNDPYFLLPWLGWLARLVRAQSCDVAFAFASSPWLCRRFGDVSSGVALHPLNPADLLRPFDMDRVAYGQDLAAPREAPCVNAPLAAALAGVMSEFRPDLILSFSANRYIGALSPGVCTVFSEMRPLPRSFGRGFFLDPCGHQADSLLVTEAARIRALDLPRAFRDETRARLEDRFTGLNRNQADTPRMVHWMRHASGGAPVALLAMQHPDWLTMEGLGDRRAPDAMLLSWLDRLPPGWRGVASYHPAYSLPRALEEAVAEQMDNFLLLPEEWRQGRSEWLVQGVDAVVTNSSAVGWAAVLAGKRVAATARSNLRGFAVDDPAALDEADTLSPAERVRLAAFLRHRYSLPEQRFLDEPNCAGRLLGAIATQGKNWFFSGFPEHVDSEPVNGEPVNSEPVNGEPMLAG